MPYPSNGSLTTDKRVIDDSDGWASQAEWEAYQSASGVEIVDGSVRLVETTTVNTYTFDDDEIGASAPGPWTAVNTEGCQVDDIQSNSPPHSYFVGGGVDLGGGGVKYIQTTFTGGQYTSELSHVYYENEVATSRSAVEFATSGGETLLYVGTNSPDFVVDAAMSEVMVSGPNTDVWNQVTVTFDWTPDESPPNVIVEFSEVGSESSTTSTYTAKSTATANLGEIAITHGGTSGDWDGTGNEVHYDDIDLPL